MERSRERWRHVTLKSKGRWVIRYRVLCVAVFLYLGGLAPNGFRYAVGNYIFTAIVRYKFGRSRERLSHVYALSLCRTEKKHVFNRIVHRRLWVEVHKILHTCRAPWGLFTVKVWRGVTGENFERIAKNLEFLHLYMQKRALCLPRGQRSNVHPVGHCLMVPQPF